MSVTVQFSISAVKAWIMASVALIAFVALFFVPAISQDPGYHLFVDHRHLLGVDNFWNVASNLPFITLGVSGLVLTCMVKMRQAWRFAGKEATSLFITFFIGILLTGIGSAYYHSNPTNLTLVWDRLPMTISFMAFFCMVIGYHASMPLAKALLAPLLALGIGSVGYWWYTEGQGHGDLRPYVLVQFLPLVLVPILISKTKAEFLKSKTIWLVIAYYATAKACEHWDGAIYEAFMYVSGHSIKHLVAALGAYVVYVHLKRDFRQAKAALAAA